MPLSRNLVRLAAVIGGFAATSAMAQQQPTGVWIDHTGRGAVEISDCGGGALCGHVVWVKDAKNNKACRTQIIGNAKPVGGGAWDRGWIIDPDDNQRYSVELKPLGADRLRVVGYMGSKIFSETMIWKRAPADLQRCDVQEATKPAPVPAPAQLAAVPAPTPMPPPVFVPSVPAPSAAPPTAIPGLPPALQSPEPLPRTAAAPPVAIPSSEPPAAAPAEPPSAVPATPAASRAQRKRAAQAERPERQANSGSKRRVASRDCSYNVPYVAITVKYPCD